MTDRVADLLYSRGLRHIFVDLGEQRAVGPRQDGAPWLVARANATPLALTGGALATSEGSGCVLGASGAAHHLFDPRSASPDEIEALMPRFTGTVVWATDHDSRERRWTSPPVDGTVG